MERVCAPETVGWTVPTSVHTGELALGARYTSRESKEGGLYDQTFTSTRTDLPAPKLPFNETTLSWSTDSSEWNRPELPSAQAPLMVLGACCSGPTVPRPSTRLVPVSQLAPTAPH